MTVASGRAIPGLNILRLIATLYIVTYHLNILTKWEVLTNFFNRGPSATSLFFLLSGFLLATRYGNLMTTREQGIFLFRRMFRLLPPAYLALIQVLPFYLVGPVRLDLPQPLQLLPYLLMVQTWFVGHSHDFVGPAWSVSCLLFFYLLLPAIAPRLHRWTTLALLSLIVAIWVWNLTVPQLLLSHPLGKTQDWLLYLHNNPLLRAPEFFVGVTLALLSRRHQWRLPMIFFAPALGIVASAMLFLPKEGPVVDNGLFLPLTILTLLAFQNPPRSLSHLASTFWVKELSDATICIYLLHQQYINIFHYFWGSTSNWTIVQIITFLIICMLVALIFNRLICRPITIALNRRYLSKLKVSSSSFTNLTVIALTDTATVPNHDVA